MSKIQVFKQEIDDGIGELVKSTASVAYCSAATLQKSEVPFPELILNLYLSPLVGIKTTMFLDQRILGLPEILLKINSSILVMMKTT